MKFRKFLEFLCSGSSNSTIAIFFTTPIAFYLLATDSDTSIEERKKYRLAFIPVVLVILVLALQAVFYFRYLIEILGCVIGFFLFINLSYVFYLLYKREKELASTFALLAFSWVITSITIIGVSFLIAFFSMRS